jgi:hypothetical protein
MTNPICDHVRAQILGPWHPLMTEAAASHVSKPVLHHTRQNTSHLVFEQSGAARNLVWIEMEFRHAQD